VPLWVTLPTSTAAFPGGSVPAQAFGRRSRDLLFVDAGDLLFETSARPPAQMLTQKQLKARTLAQGDVLLGAAARAVGQRDLALGAPFMRRLREGSAPRRRGGSGSPARAGR